MTTSLKHERIIKCKQTIMIYYTLLQGWQRRLLHLGLEHQLAVIARTYELDQMNPAPTTCTVSPSDNQTSLLFTFHTDHTHIHISTLPYSTFISASWWYYEGLWKPLESTEVTSLTHQNKLWDAQWKVSKQKMQQQHLYSYTVYFHSLGGSTVLCHPA